MVRLEGRSEELFVASVQLQKHLTPRLRMCKLVSSIGLKSSFHFYQYLQRG